MYPIPEARLDVGGHLDREPEKILQLEMQCRQIEEAGSRRHVDEEIDVAVWSGSPAGHRSVDAQV